MKNVKNVTNMKNIMVRMIERTRNITWREVLLIKTAKINISATDKIKKELV